MNKENNKGFTLVELIMAIGILMLAAGFIIQIFVTAKGLNAKAFDLDRSVALTTSIVEELKGLESQKDIEAFLNNTAAVVIVSGSDITFERYFDKDWNETSAPPQGFYYKAEGTVMKSNQSTGLVQFELSVDKITAADSPKRLFELKASQHYLP